MRPGLILTGPAQRLAAPLVQMNLIAALDHRRANIRLRMNSRALAVAAEGLVDLGQNRYQDLRLAARLTEPGAIAPNLSGRDVQLAMILNGAFRTPGVAYELTAASLTFGTTTVENLRAVGAATVRAQDIIVPVSARASRIIGFDAVAGGTLSNVTLNGQLGVAGMRLVSDNMILRSDRVNARLALAFDLAAGRYLAALQGRVNNYLVNSVGLFDVDTHLDMTSRAGRLRPDRPGRGAQPADRQRHDPRPARRRRDDHRADRDGAVGPRPCQQRHARLAAAARRLGRRHL